MVSAGRHAALMSRIPWSTSRLCMIASCPQGVNGRNREAGGGAGRIPCHEGSRQRFREREVCRIVRRDGVPELPNPGQQHVVRIATQGQRGEVLKRLGAARGVELRGERVSAQDLGHFEVQQVWVPQ